MEVDIEKLRQSKRPLWMTDFGIESFADMLGGGGDVKFDRIPLEWPRYSGYEEDDGAGHSDN